MVHIEVVIDIIIFRRCQLKRRVMRTAVVVRKQRLATESAKISLHAGGHARLQLAGPLRYRRMYAVRPEVRGQLVFAQVGRERRVRCALCGQPRLPRRQNVRIVTHATSPAHEKASLVHERDKRQSRFVNVTAPGVPVFVQQEVPRILRPVLERRLVHGAKGLKKLNVHCPVAIHAYVTPLDDAGTRNEEICRNVQAFADRGCKQVIKPFHVVDVECEAVSASFDGPGIMVVDAQRVVAQAFQARDKRLRKRMAWEVCRSAEVHAVEALTVPRKPLELEVSADVP